MPVEAIPDKILKNLGGTYSCLKGINVIDPLLLHIWISDFISVVDFCSNVDSEGDMGYFGRGITSNSGLDSFTGFGVSDTTALLLVCQMDAILSWEFLKCWALLLRSDYFGELLFS